MSKNWGIANGVNPVRYIHENSLRFAKNTDLIEFFFMLSATANVNVSKSYFLSAFIATLSRTGKTLNEVAPYDDSKTFPDIDEAIYRDILEEIISNSLAIENIFEDKPELKRTFTYLIVSLEKVIEELIKDHIENASYIRVIEDEFECKKKRKIKKYLYDEREWRYVYIPSVSGYFEKREQFKYDLIKLYENMLADSEIGYIQDSNKYLKFGDNDLYQIVVKDEQDINALVPIMKEMGFDHNKVVTWLDYLKEIK